MTILQFLRDVVITGAVVLVLYWVLSWWGAFDPWTPEQAYWKAYRSCLTNAVYIVDGRSGGNEITKETVDNAFSKCNEIKK